MFQTTLSPASTKNALLTSVRPGLIIDAKGGGGGKGGNLAGAAKAAGAVGSVASLATSATNLAGVAVGDVVDAVGDVAGDAIDAVGDFFSSIFYLSPGRMSATDVRVADDASVDELISVTRGRAV